MNLFKTNDFSVFAHKVDGLVQVDVFDLWSRGILPSQSVTRASFEEAQEFVARHQHDYQHNYYSVPPCWVQLEGADENNPVCLVPIGFALPSVFGVIGEDSRRHSVVLLGAVSVQSRNSPWEVARRLASAISPDPMTALDAWRETEQPSSMDEMGAPRVVPFKPEAQ